MKYLGGYPAALLAPAEALLAQGRLGQTIAAHYPEGHEVRSDRALVEYVATLKRQYMRSAPPLAKVAYDPKLHIVRNALGTHTAVSRVQGNQLKAKREIRVASLRRRRTEVVTASVHLRGSDDDEDTDLLATLPSGAAGPLELLLQAAQQREVTDCVQALSAEQQQCVALAYYQGLSHSEVAAQMAQPLGTVKSWVRRALIALKDCLSPHGADRAAKA